jgi:hypothetical protein
MHTSESSALLSHWCLVRHAWTTCIFKSSAIESCERLFCSRSIKLWNSFNRTSWPISTHWRGNSFSAHCCNLTSTVVLNPLKSIWWICLFLFRKDRYLTDSAWAAVIKTSLKINSDIFVHKYFDTFSSLEFPKNKLKNIFYRLLPLLTWY